MNPKDFLQKLAVSEGYDSFGHKLFEVHPDSVELEKMFEQVLLEYAFENSYSINNDRDVAKGQIAERGFDDSETWSLEVTFAKFMLPRFKRFRELQNKFVTEAEDYSMDLIEEMLEIVANDQHDNVLTKRQVEVGLERFSKLFFQLWW